ncbi:Kil protein [Yokenella regensburgei]|uniref:Kil protein n=1 Tax=Yokenella regensburgei TaxID=158877 RepID=A0ABX9RZL3_9ENTR|nr:host cell division inhibitory peptide Kil [Yokenella regensburgei]EHM46049.1 hypothetical protein HMPREF0880_04100 [Yokenella regensburgei ATCC 43003]RKR63993.1 Kil protein [Yokenella regensburgei]VFS25598.1 Uncharacterised protein [Yokenella regensburgei]
MSNRYWINVAHSKLTIAIFLCDGKMMQQAIDMYWKAKRGELH